MRTSASKPRGARRHNLKASDIQATLAARGARYGTLSANGELSQNLKWLLRSHAGWESLAADQREAADVICSKLARIFTGDPNYADNWHDIAGYAKLVDNRLTTGSDIG